MTPPGYTPDSLPLTRNELARILGISRWLADNTSGFIPCMFKNHTHDEKVPAAYMYCPPDDVNVCEFTCKKCNRVWTSIDILRKIQEMTGTIYYIPPPSK